MADIQARLAYIASVKQREDAKNIDATFYLQPPVSQYGTLEFGSFKNIVNDGYQYGQKIIDEWIANGVLAENFGVYNNPNLARRASI